MILCGDLAGNGKLAHGVGGFDRLLCTSTGCGLTWRLEIPCEVLG